MKKIIVFVFLLCSISSFAQQNTWDVGIVGGAGITGLRVKSPILPSPDPIIGFYTGLSGRFNINEHFALHAELAFDRKGGIYKGFTVTDVSGNELGTSQIISQFNYLTLPLLFRASTGNKVRYFAQAGPYLSYLLNQTTKHEATVDDPQYNFNQNRTSSFATMTAGITAGLGVLIPVKEKLSVSGEVRGNYGLTSSLSKTAANNGSKAFNKSLNFLVGISYSLGK